MIKLYTTKDTFEAFKRITKEAVDLVDGNIDPEIVEVLKELREKVITTAIKVLKMKRIDNN